MLRNGRLHAEDTADAFMRLMLALGKMLCHKIW